MSLIGILGKKYLQVVYSSENKQKIIEIKKVNFDDIYIHIMSKYTNLA